MITFTSLHPEVSEASHYVVISSATMWALKKCLAIQGVCKGNNLHEECKLLDHNKSLLAVYLYPLHLTSKLHSLPFDYIIMWSTLHSIYVTF